MALTATQPALEGAAGDAHGLRGVVDRETVDAIEQDGDLVVGPEQVENFVDG
jgi:hypothetical protein